VSEPEGSDEFIVRRASLADREAIGAFLEEARLWIADQGHVQWTRPFRADWIDEKIQSGEFYLATQRGVPVAVVRLLWADPVFWGERDDGSAAYVHSLAVRRDLAGKGIGGRVLRWAEAQARARGRRSLRLDCALSNPALFRYYERSGFTPVGPTCIGDACVMLFERELDA
jgi:ribosomal protein S18 acetylase RimI-like enzyme